MPPVVSFIGRPDCGKTTLLEKLIPELTRRGYRIGTIKHHLHRFEMDIPGKDTWRHKQAGAQVVALSSPSGLGIIRNAEQDADIAELVGRYFFDVDLVLTEGYKTGNYPKIEVFRRAAHPAPLQRDHTWAALVTDDDACCEPPLPCFRLDDIAPLADFLVDSFLRTVSPKTLTLLVDGQPVPLTPDAGRRLTETLAGIIGLIAENGSRDQITITLRYDRF